MTQDWFIDDVDDRMEEFMDESMFPFRDDPRRGGVKWRPPVSDFVLGVDGADTISPSGPGRTVATRPCPDMNETVLRRPLNDPREVPEPDDDRLRRDLSVGAAPFIFK